MAKSARRLLQGILAVQAAFALVLACVALALGAPAWRALLVGLGSVALVRLAINLNNFLLSTLAASPTPPAYRLDWPARLRLFAEEFGCSMLVTSWHAPRGRAAMRVHPDSAHPPVLLVHGYGCNSGYWHWLVPLLDAARISHAGVDLEPVGGDIDDFADQVEQRVRALCAATGAGRVAIVGHSMGGIVARAWMRRHGTARVARVITLGSPHHGTALAKYGPGANAVQMRIGSPWLQALADGETAAVRALVTSIWTHQDNIVAPQTTSALPGARNLEFGGVGHVALGRNPRVLAAVMRELDALRAR
jgi:triacylglycerol esterase/lipase EstA (alpha/beta hydrolase family)